MDRITIDTDRIVSNCWVSGPEDGQPVLLVHGNITTGRFWQAVAERLPAGYRVVAPDLRAFGRTEAKPIDATRGLRDWSDDLRALVEKLGWADRGAIHAAGWSMGGGILQQYAIDHAGDLASLTLVAPLSPYGFGATRDVAGTPTNAEFSGSGGGAAAPDFVRRLKEKDASEEEPTSSPRVTMRSFFWSAKYKAPDEDELIEEVLLTAIGDGAYPGDSIPSASWPMVGPGAAGVNNAMSPKWCNTSGFAAIGRKVPVIWVRGDEDQVVSDASLFDFGTLGKIGAVPGWPGEEEYPSQPAVSQMRAVLDRYTAAGGHYREVVLEGCGHGPVVERPAEVAALIQEQVESAKPVAG
jgi:pimeloyl-ACP methyl ester carboxylesterase